MEAKTAVPTIIAPPQPSKMAQLAISEHLRHGGATFDPRTGDNLAGTKSIAVGVAPEHELIDDKPFTAQDHDNFVAAHQEVLSKHAHSAVSTRYDSDTGLHHMSIVGLTPSKNVALDMAAHLGEKHVHNLATNEKIPTGSSESKATHLSVEQRFDHLRTASPKREPYAGTHFSDKKLDKIEGARRGELGAKKMAATNADSARVHLGTKTGQGPDAPGGFYTIKAGEAAPPLAAAKPHSYEVRGQFAFGSTESPEFKNGYVGGMQSALAAGAKPDVAHHLGLNAAEHALQDAGYDGYHSPAHPNIRFHFGDHEASPVSAKEKLDAPK